MEDQALAESRRTIHSQVDRMTEDEVVGLKKFLETFPDWFGAILRNLPWDDEPWTEEDERAVAESEEWFERNGGRGIPHEEIVREHGLRQRADSAAS